MITVCRKHRHNSFGSEYLELLLVCRRMFWEASEVLYGSHRLDANISFVTLNPHVRDEIPRIMFPNLGLADAFPQSLGIGHLDQITHLALLITDIHHSQSSCGSLDWAAFRRMTKLRNLHVELRGGRRFAQRMDPNRPWLWGIVSQILLNVHRSVNLSCKGKRRVRAASSPPRL